MGQSLGADSHCSLNLTPSLNPGEGQAPVQCLGWRWQEAMLVETLVRTISRSRTPKVGAVDGGKASGHQTPSWRALALKGTPALRASPGILE